MMVVTCGKWVRHDEVDIFSFNNSDSGYVKLVGAVYSFATGWQNCIIQKYTLLRNQTRAIMRFNTATIPDDATIDIVELYAYHRLAQPSPSSLDSATHIGSWCGAALDASANDYNAPGSLDISFNIIPFGNAWIDLSSAGPDPTGYVNKTGYTDIQIRDTSIGPAAAYGYNFNDTKADEKCKLRVTYHYERWEVPKHIQLLGGRIPAEAGSNGDAV